MKTLITFLVSTLFVVSGFAQYGQRQYGQIGQTVTINFNGHGNNNDYPNGQYKTPMADDQFSKILQNVRGKWFQSNKVRDVRDAFTSTGVYYSTYQITQLLQLISSESNRLELAELSYRVVAD